MKKVWISALVFWVVASALACWLYPIMIFDACNRYAPMADAIAAGDWAHAFHPRFGVLFQAVSGAVAFVSGLEGQYAVQVASFLFLSLAGVVMFAFAKELTKSEKVAWWTFALVLLAPDFYRFALDGLREPVKCLAFALFGYAVVVRRGWAFGLGLLVYMTTFVYGFACSTVLLLCWFAYLVYLRKVDGVCLTLPQLMSQALAAAGLYFGGAVVSCAMVYAYTGYFVPAAQFIGLVGGRG